MAEASGSSKRRRTSPVDGIVLRDLPNEALCYAASFLSAPSKVLFAIALSDDDASKAIIHGKQWDILDFSGENFLAAKITDNLLQEILVCVGAITKLRRLKLAGCINISGVGLHHLRGSVVLEQIDLSLVAEHKSPDLDPEPLLSCDHVVPILDSIIGKDDNVLRSIVFPKKWRVRSTVLTEFLGRCNQLFEARNIVCGKCNESVEGTFDEWFPLGGQYRSREEYYGIQSYTCYKCTKHFCYDCEDEESGCGVLRECKICRKDYCRQCEPMHRCADCENYYCRECKSMTKCGECGDYYCGDCDGRHECTFN